MNKRIGWLVKATAFAAHKHRAQRRKDVAASPYINHPIALADILTNEAGIEDPVVVSAALLHDTLEDTETTYEELEREFGPDIASIVLEVTDDKQLTKAERKRLQVESAARKSAQAKLVKIADKIANLRDLVEHPPAGWSAERKREYFEWARRVIEGLRGTHARLEQLFDEAYARKP